MPDATPPDPYFSGPMWNWFGLTYSSYLVLPRTLLCGMPTDWQARMVALLEEMRATYNSAEIRDDYCVTLRQRGKFVQDPLANYRHPPELPYRPEYKESTDALDQV